MKLPRFATFPLLVAGLLSAGCHTRPPEPRLLVTGTLNYDNFVVTPGCTIEVRLDDVSRADAPATTLAREFISPQASAPIPFTLRYVPSEIDPAHRYVVAARITCGGELQMVTDSAYPVITQGNPSTASLALKAVNR